QKQYVGGIRDVLVRRRAATGKGRSSSGRGRVLKTASDAVSNAAANPASRRSPNRAFAVAPGAQRRRQRSETERVVDETEKPQSRLDRSGPLEYLACQEGGDRVSDAERVACVHEQRPDDRRRHPIDEPRESGQSAAYVALELRVEARCGGGIAQELVDDVGAERRAVHREVDTAGEHRIDERPRIANQQIALSRHPCARIRVVAGGGCWRGDPGGAKTCGKVGAQRNRVHQEL